MKKLRDKLQKYRFKARPSDTSDKLKWLRLIINHKEEIVRHE